MPKSINRTYSRYSLNATELLGALIREARIQQKHSAQSVADRAGISRGLLQRIEKGDPKCEIGVAFEVAKIVGVVLFEESENRLSEKLDQTKKNLALLPKSAPKNSKAVRDDF